MNATSLAPQQCRPPAGDAAHSPSSASNVDGFETFAPWDDTPLYDGEGSTSDFQVLSQRAISKISQPRLDETSSSRFDPSELSYETSFASLTPTSIYVETTIKGVKEDTWPFTKFSLPPKQVRPSIVRLRKDSSSSSSRSDDVPLLSTAWSDLSSSSISTALTCSTSTLASASFADLQTFESRSNSSYFLEADGTVLAVAYPIPDPLLTVTPTTSATMPQGLPQDTAHPQPDIELPMLSSSRKTAVVDMPPGSQHEFNAPVSAMESNSDPCVPTVPENQAKGVDFVTSANSIKVYRPNSFKFKNEAPRSPRPPYLASNLSTSQITMDQDDTIMRRKSVRFAEPLCEDMEGSPTSPAEEEEMGGSPSSLAEEVDVCLVDNGIFTYIPQQVHTVHFHLHASSGSWEVDSYEPDFLEPALGTFSEAASSTDGISERSDQQEHLNFDTYMMLQQDAAYRHAMSAGYLWQSLVGQHVSFPSSWWKGARGPSMGVEDPSTLWMYIARHRVQANSFLNQLVPRRTSPGQLLLHIIVQDLVTWKPVQDIVLGCFHSNARGVRRTDHAVPDNDKCREVWMAVRKRCDDVSMVDCLLTEGEKLENCARQSPLMGSRHQVTNVNLKAVFGEEPPRRTLFILENDLYTRLIEAAEMAPKQPPALLLLAQSFSNPVDI